MADPVLLPAEIWCHIFLYMDGASTRNASAVCRLFFGILRGDERYSGHVILKQINLSQLVMKIKSKEWTWERWPCLKILEMKTEPVSYYGPQEFKIDFKEDPQPLNPTIINMIEVIQVSCDNNIHYIKMKGYKLLSLQTS